DALEVAGRESAADAPRIAPAVRGALREEQRAERLASGFRRQAADDRELVAGPCADLDPIGRAPADVRRIRALADDAFDAELADLREHPLAVGGDVLGEADRADGRQDRREQPLALEQRQGSDV